MHGEPVVAGANGTIDVARGNADASATKLRAGPRGPIARTAPPMKACFSGCCVRPILASMEHSVPSGKSLGIGTGTSQYRPGMSKLSLKPIKRLEMKSAMNITCHGWKLALAPPSSGLSQVCERSRRHWPPTVSVEPSHGTPLISDAAPWWCGLRAERGGTPAAMVLTAVRQASATALITLVAT